MRAVPASSLRLDRLVEVWNAAYAGYFVPLSWDVGQLDRHVTAGSVDLDHSLVWLDDAEPVALSLLGVRPGGSGERGWIGGFGIAPSHRGRGLSTVLVLEQLEAARARGLRRVQLEVLTQNWAARTYERAGFATSRRLSVLQGALGPAGPGGRALPPVQWLAPGEVPELAGQLGRLHAAYAAAWTREPTSTLGFADGLRCLVVGAVDEVDAVAIVREDGGGLQGLDAVARDERAARALVAGLSSGCPGRACRVVNEPDDSPLVAAFEGAGLVEVLAQREMHWSA